MSSLLDNWWAVGLINPVFQAATNHGNRLNRSILHLFRHLNALGTWMTYLIIYQFRCQSLSWWRMNPALQISTNRFISDRCNIVQQSVLCFDHVRKREDDKVLCHIESSTNRREWCYRWYYQGACIIYMYTTWCSGSQGSLLPCICYTYQMYQWLIS